MYVQHIREPNLDRLWLQPSMLTTTLCRIHCEIEIVIKTLGRDETVSPDTSTVDRRPLRFSWSTSTTEVFYLVDVDQTEVFYLVDVVDVDPQCL